MKNMQKTTDYYVVKQKAVPEVLLKVVEAKRLLHPGCGGKGGYQPEFFL